MIASLLLLLQAAQPFNVDSVRGPTKRLEFTATEGTWLSVDVSPDGQKVVFDLLGTLSEMPLAGGDAVPLTKGRSYNHLPRSPGRGGRSRANWPRSHDPRHVWVTRHGQILPLNFHGERRGEATANGRLGDDGHAGGNVVGDGPDQG